MENFLPINAPDFQRVEFNGEPVQTMHDLPKDKREKIYRIEEYVALQYQIIMLEGGDELTAKLEGLFAARQTLIQRALNGEM